MQVVLAGASGLLGNALKESLRSAGHEIRLLVRHPSDQPGEHEWEPAAGVLDPDVLRSADAVVCLSGAAVASRRWTDSYKRTLVSSRVDSVATIARTLVEHGGPRTLVCASAVGYYGDTGSRAVDETARPGDGFLSQLCVQWESAAAPARDAGIRVAHLRTGLVLSRRGGLLKPLSWLFKTGLGGRLGNGQQYMPWISLTDEIAAIRFVLDNEVSGPVNLTAPSPVTNAEFTRALGSALHRPTLLPVPGFAIRIAIGELAGEALSGQRAVPKKLTDSGFSFTHPDLTDALHAELG